MTSRLYAGFLLWGRRITGHFRYHYQDLASLGIAYNGLARWQEPNRYNALVYPSLGEDEPTIGWELAREGVDDYRYVATLERLIHEAPGTDNATRAAEIATDLGALRAEAAASGPKAEPASRRWTAARLHAARRSVIDWILELGS